MLPLPPLRGLRRLLGISFPLFGSRSGRRPRKRFRFARHASRRGEEQEVCPNAGYKVLTCSVDGWVETSAPTQTAQPCCRRFGPTYRVAPPPAEKRIQREDAQRAPPRVASHEPSSGTSHTNDRIPSAPELNQPDFGGCAQPLFPQGPVLDVQMRNPAELACVVVCH